MMGLISYANEWAKNEVYQGKVMIAIGVVLIVPFLLIFRTENQLLKGALFPLSILLAIMLCYGSFILYSRPKHAKETIRLYCSSPEDAKRNEILKHEKDNKAGNFLIKIYPILMIISVLALMAVSSPYYKGMAIGFLLLFICTFIIDNGFVSRSNHFLTFLKSGLV